MLSTEKYTSKTIHVLTHMLTHSPFCVLYFALIKNEIQPKLPELHRRLSGPALGGEVDLHVTVERS